MKKRVNFLSGIGLISLLVFLCGCQKSPEKNTVISKNDGSFDASIIQSATESEQSANPNKISIDEVFYSTDGTVEFRLSIDQNETMKSFPVVEVAPHYLSENDVRRVAYALFGNVQMYEAEPELAPIYSQDEIREKIERWSQYANENSVTELLGNNSQDTVALIKQFIENYTKLYDSAPVNNPHMICEWKYQKESYYEVAQDELSSINLEDDNDKIAATVQLENIHYYFAASTRNKEDFKLNNIRAYLYDGIGPNMLDEHIFRAWLCRTEEPTTEQVSNVKNEAEKMLEQMQLGEWHIDECYVETKLYGDIPEYIIHINAVPVLNGVPAIRVPQLTNLKSEEVYASNYYITDAEFEFSARGDLVSFRLYSPIDIVNIVNDNVAVKSTNELLELAKSYLELSDYYEYGFGPVIDSLGEEINCTITIEKLESNLVRVKAPNSDERYYYVPAIVLKGNVEYSSAAVGDIYYTSNNVTLVTINAVDGTIIQS